jgi:acetyl esterase/lipase
VDAADRESSRPDFAIAIYPGHLALAENSIALNPNIKSHITPQTPPTFLLQNEDDHVDSIEDALSYYMGLKAANVPVELHAYAQGGHAFGLRPSKLPVSGWPQLVEKWLATIGILSVERSPIGMRTGWWRLPWRLGWESARRHPRMIRRNGRRR